VRRWSTVTATARCESRHCLLHRVGSPQTAAPVRTRNHAGARGDACPRSRLATRVEAFGEPSARMPEVEASRSSATPRSRSRSRRSRLTASDSACTVSVNVRRVKRGMAMASGDFVSYLRVSTNHQGIGGLGIEAQREAVHGYLNGGNWRVVEEFVEVESGRNADRPALARALAAARLYRAPLIVANVSRLTRSVSFLSRLLDAGVDVRFADLPSLEGPTGRFMLQQMAIVAEFEAGLISSRTKAALKAAKARGKKLGGFRGHAVDDAARSASLAVRRSAATARASDLAPVIAELRASGVTSLRGIAGGLRERGITAPRGGASWSAGQVALILAKLNAK
jgi:DNA invertase Pin-like site-specific DNA recombinase